MTLASLFDRADNSLLKEFKLLVPQINSHFSFDPGIHVSLLSLLGSILGTSWFLQEMLVQSPSVAGDFDRVELDPRNYSTHKNK